MTEIYHLKDTIQNNEWYFTTFEKAEVFVKERILENPEYVSFADEFFWEKDVELEEIDIHIWYYMIEEWKEYGECVFKMKKEIVDDYSKE